MRLASLRSWLRSAAGELKLGLAGGDQVGTSSVLTPHHDNARTRRRPGRSHAPGARAWRLTYSMSCSWELIGSAPVRGHDPAPRPVGTELPRERGVGELEVEDRLDLGRRQRVVDRRHQLHAVVEVAGHHVRRPDPVVRPPADRERERAGVLEEAPDDRDDADVLAHAGDAGAQAGDAADDQVDGHPRLRRAVDRRDDRPVDDGVHLHHDARGRLRACARRWRARSRATIPSRRWAGATRARR